MGNSCVRFRSVDGQALDVIAETVAATDVETFVAQYRDACSRS